MTDKIIIDGCDVSGCKYWKGYCRISSLCDYSGHLCEVNPNCYYKQLRRKEQECEKLRSIIRKTQTYKDICCDCRDEILLYPSISGKTNYTQIEVEERSLERIIQQLEAYKMEATEGKEINAELKAENEELKKVSCKFKDYCTCDTEKLKQTLTEIKEIAEECYYKCNSMNNCNISCKYYNDCNGEFSYLLAYLNKQIREVENDMENN